MKHSARPRMLVIGSDWPPQTFMDGLFRGLSERGIEIWIAHRRRLRRQQGEPNLGIRHLSLPTNRFGRPGRMLHGLGLATLATLRRPLTSASVARQAPTSALDNLPFLRRSFDLLYFPWNSAAVRHLPLFQVGIPSLISCRGTQIMVAPLDPQREPLRRGLPDSFARATAVHCVAEAVRDRASELGLDAAKATVIRPGVDIDRFAPPSEPRVADPNGPFRLVQTGTLRWVKGHEYALRAIRLLVDRGRSVELHVLGDGPERQRLLFGIHDMELSEHVRWHGAVTPAEVADHLARARAFLLPSLSEGISNAALEAMACGLPVISTTCGGMAEAIESGQDGLLVPLRDPEAIAAAVTRLMDEPGLAESLGRAARARIETELSLDQHIDAFHALCTRTLAGAPASSKKGRT